MRKPELLVPAGNLEILKTAVLFGADAVYLGGEAFSLRAKADNFTPSALREGLLFAREQGVKVYVTANILAHNDDLAKAREYFGELAEIEPDAIIVADPGMFLLAREICPDLPLHISTQANNTNYLTYRFWYEQGVRRVVAARELSLAELAEIRAHIPPDMEIEAFVHGAMCISYSGRCLLSNYFTGQDANQGACTHPCRWKYAVVEETRPNQYLPVDENERGTFIFNSRDLCMIEYIPELIKAGIDSFKIEGRMKSELYVATVTRAYRQALDDFLFSEETYRERMDWYRQEIRSTTYRHHATGFYFGKPGQDGQIYDEATYLTEAVYLGTVEAVVNRPYNHRLCFEQKNKFTVGEQIEIIKPSGENVVATVLAIYDEDGNPQNAAPHAKQLLAVELSERAEAGDLLRRK